MQYSTRSIELALENKNAISQVEASLKDFMKIITNDHSDNDDNISSSIEELLEINKNADDQIMQDTCYARLNEDHSKK
ncbi:hypothetical protein F8M41_016422 [Gigaspora margarita]|uniref:Uncharacterized protein n=1 Tax=Gigaspora margarita TaxID=4874 RepID=A0A8H4APD3_GIGMA|nr:hypothetical protein F8M41_016422 [Gigaspora margarita]